jgi:DNA-directed RNA polymerase subunit H
MASASASAAGGGGGGAAAAPAKSSLEPGVADIILRSRQTILDILDDRGYDVTAYRNIAPDQILTIAEKNTIALNVFAPKRADSNAPCERAVVVYMLHQRVKTRLGTFVRDIFEETVADPTFKVNKGDDIIVILNEPYQEAFDKASYEMWSGSRVRMVFFHIKQLVSHPGRHVLVPPHRKLTAEEVTALMERLHVKSKSQFPAIKHDDIQSRVLGLVPGDVVEIQRPSPTAGIALYYRACQK